MGVFFAMGRFSDGVFEIQVGYCRFMFSRGGRVL